MFVTFLVIASLDQLRLVGGIPYNTPQTWDRFSPCLIWEGDLLNLFYRSNLYQNGEAFSGDGAKPPVCFLLYDGLGGGLFLGVIFISLYKSSISIFIHLGIPKVLHYSFTNASQS